MVAAVNSVGGSVSRRPAMAANTDGSSRTDDTGPSPAPGGVPSVIVRRCRSWSSTVHAFTSSQSWSSDSIQKIGTAGTP